MTTRIYHIEMYANEADGGGINHLVEAGSKAQALAHVFKTRGAVELASAKLVAHLVGRGHGVELAE